jgi:polyphosphate kinase
MSEIDLTNPSYYINRELSTIEFQRRVLHESYADHPILERVKYLAIVSANLDEFFMVRVSGLKQQVLLGITERPPDGLTPREQLVAIHRTLTPLFKEMMTIWHETILPELDNVGIRILNYDEI